MIIRPIHPVSPLNFIRIVKRNLSTWNRWYIPTWLEGVEDLEDYRPRGYHPISIGDRLSHYKVIHKLGYGGSSTVWLARDLESNDIVTVKALRADASVVPIEQHPEVTIPRTVLDHSSSSSDLELIRPVSDYFSVNGPNGSHHVLISPFAGPSLKVMSQCPGRASGSRRLRADLARMIARQVATAVQRMHTAGLLHGDITTSNILLLPSQDVLKWSDEQIYFRFDSPETEPVRLREGALKDHAPAYIVAPIYYQRLVEMPLVEEIILTDFGQSCNYSPPPPNYQPGTTMHYLSPEAHFKANTIGPPMDVWSLGCTFFEIRAGSPLFEPFLSSDTDILKQTVETLGKLPDPWWDAFREKSKWFEENGKPKSLETQTKAGIVVPAVKNSIREMLRAIGENDDLPPVYEGQMIEQTGTRLSEDEVECFGDLLEGMLRYRPEDRITMQEVLEHPWFTSPLE